MLRLPVLLALFLLVGCNREPDCVEADDWGYPKISLSADYKKLVDKDELVTYPDNQYLQYSVPIDSGQMLLGGKTVITLDRQQNYWMPFMGTWLNPTIGDDLNNRIIQGWWPEKLIPNRECRYFKFTPQDYNHLDENFYDTAVPFDQPTIALQKMSLSNCVRDKLDPGSFVKSDFFGDCLAPCVIRHGVGILMAVFPDRKSLAEYASLTPSEVVIRHLTDFDMNGPLNEEEGREKPDGFLVNAPIPGAKKDGRLYFKLAETFYLDDIGGYRIHIKCGTRPVSLGPFESVTSYVKKLSMLFTEGLFRQITEDNGFINMVRSLLVLHVMLYAYGFMTGYVNAQIRDMAFHIFRAGMMIALISPTAWEVFYDHFFVIFYSSIEAAIGYFLQTMPSLYNGCEIFDKQSPWYTADYIFHVMTADETWQKVAATLFSNPWGFLFIIAFIIAFFFFIYGIVTLTISYVGSLISLGIMFIIFPFFIILTLFRLTSVMFQNWFRNAFSFALEIILSVAMLGMFFQIIMDLLLKTIGFRVCWKSVFEAFPGFKLISIGFFMPSISAEKTKNFTIDGTGTKGERYIDIPYFDPEKEGDKIEKYLNNKNFIDMGDILAFLAIVIMMYYGSRALLMMIRAMKADKGYQSAADVNLPMRNFMQSISNPLFGMEGTTFSGNHGGLLNLEFTRSSMTGGLPIKPRVTRQAGGLFDNRIFGLASEFANKKVLGGVRNVRLDSSYKGAERSFTNAETALKNITDKIQATPDKGGTYDATQYLRHGELFYGDARKMLGKYDSLLENTGSKRLRRSATEHAKQRYKQMRVLRNDTALNKPVTLEEATKAQDDFSKALKTLNKEATSGKAVSDNTRKAAKDARDDYRLVLDKLAQNPVLYKTPEATETKGMGYSTTPKQSGDAQASTATNSGKEKTSQSTSGATPAAAAPETKSDKDTATSPEKPQDKKPQDKKPQDKKPQDKKPQGQAEKEKAESVNVAEGLQTDTNQQKLDVNTDPTQRKNKDDKDAPQ